MSDNLWDCFGSDESSGEETVSSPPIALHIETDRKKVATSVPRLNWKDFIPSPTTSAAQTTKSFESLVVPFAHAPIFQASCLRLAIVSDRIGGRGFVVDRDVDEGTLLLLESPLLQMPSLSSREEIDIGSVEFFIIELLEETPESASVIISDLSHLHPKTLKDLHADQIESIRNRYNAFLEIAANMIALRSLGLELDDILRLLCAFHFNSFETGVYIHHAMLNHSCKPNCIKWTITSGNKHLSELRATEFIPAGSEITVNYLHPHEQSYQSRCNRIESQFDFKCSCQLCFPPEGSSLKYLEYITGDVLSATDIDLTFSKVLDEYEVAVETARDGKRDVAWGKLLARVLMAGQATGNHLGSMHLTLARGHRFICICCSELLANESMSVYVEKSDWSVLCSVASNCMLLDFFQLSGWYGKENVTPQGTQRIWLLTLLLCSALQLRKIHMVLFGHGFHALVSENIDAISQSILMLLAQGVEGQAVLNRISEIHDMGTGAFTDWADFAAANEKASIEIGKLYR